MNNPLNLRLMDIQISYITRLVHSIPLYATRHDTPLRLLSHFAHHASNASLCSTYLVSLSNETERLFYDSER